MLKKIFKVVKEEIEYKRKVSELSKKMGEVNTQLADARHFIMSAFEVGDEETAKKYLTVIDYYEDKFGALIREYNRLVNEHDKE